MDITNLFEKYLEETQGIPLFLCEKKPYNHCEWLKIGKKERCGKRCKQFYCRTHSEYIIKGGLVPLPCLCCGVGVRRSNQLCTRCEKNMGLNINEIKQARNHHIKMGRGRKGDIIDQGNKNKKDAAYYQRKTENFFVLE